MKMEDCYCCKVRGAMWSSRYKRFLCNKCFEICKGMDKYRKKIAKKAKVNHKHKARMAKYRKGE